MKWSILVVLFPFIVFAQADFWEEIWRINENQNILDIEINKNGNLFALTDAGIFMSNPQKSTWEYRAPDIKNKVTINSLGHLFSNSGEIIYRSIDNGATWEPVLNAWDYEKDCSDWWGPTTITQFVLDKDDSAYATIKSCNTWLLKTSAQTNTWHKLEIETPLGSLKELSAIKDEHNFWIGSNPVYFTHDGGVTWEEFPLSSRIIAVNPSLSNETIQCLTFLSPDNDIYFVAYVPQPEIQLCQIYRYTPFSDNMTLLTDLGYVDAESIRLFFSNSGQVIIIDGVFYQTRQIKSLIISEEGNKQIELPEQFRPNCTDALDYVYVIKDRHILLKTRKAFSSSVADKAQKTKKVHELQVFQNYPNPFNGTTVINFELASSTHCAIKIFDVFGKEINSLMNERLAPGNYKVAWDGTNSSGLRVSSGVYFIYLVSDDHLKTIKAVYTK